MNITILVVEIVAAVGLLGFGAWVVFAGVSYILRKYDWKLSSSSRGLTKGPLIGEMLSSLVNLVSAENIATRDGPPADGNGTPAANGETPAGGNASAADGQADANAKKTTLEGVAELIKTLPDLLKADFGPIVVVCIAGLAIMGAGFYIVAFVLKIAGQ